MKLDVRELAEQANNLMGKDVILEGWIRNHRKQKEFGFIEFYDGTSFKNLQIVYDNKLVNFDAITKYMVGSSIRVYGKLVESQGKQEFEISASNIELLGDCDESYPIQPKRHTREFLR